MRIITFLAWVFAISEGVLGFKYITGEGEIAPSVTYLFKVRDPARFPPGLTIYDACERLLRACDNYVRTLYRKEKTGIHFAHHALNCRPDLSALPAFYASCGYRISPTPGEPSTFNANDIPIDVTYAALSRTKHYRIYPRGDETLRGISLPGKANSASHHFDSRHPPPAQHNQQRSRNHQG